MAEPLRSWVKSAERIVFFGGAGVSTESGIPDFRSRDGLYHMKYSHPPETILSSEFFHRHPEVFFAFYREKILHPEARPNPAHVTLAGWEGEGRLSAVITQNIDGLHQMAGSRAVVELHGSVRSNHCTGCRRFYGLEDILATEGVPRCLDCAAVIKPDVVLFGEPLNETAIREAIRRISEADLLIVGGTSLAVYPAAGLVDYFRGDKLVLINRDATPLDRRAGLVIREPIGAYLRSIR